MQEELPLFDETPRNEPDPVGLAAAHDVPCSESEVETHGQNDPQEDPGKENGEPMQADIDSSPALDPPESAVSPESVAPDIVRQPIIPGFHRALVVSIHDISPHTLPAVERILVELKALGVNECSLLVVADHHRRGHMLDDLQFCSWLQNQIAAGHEAVIHGYFHARDRRPDDSIREKLTTRFYTRDEGEFFDIAGADALRIVSQARSEFRKLGVEPGGFIAPAWLLSEAGEFALRVLGIEYTTLLTRVNDLVTGKTYRSQSLVWSVRSGWRRFLSRGWNALLFHRLRENRLLRIGIHPTDIEHPVIWRQIHDLIRRALEDRTPISYSKWVETNRVTAHDLQS